MKRRLLHKKGIDYLSKSIPSYIFYPVNISAWKGFASSEIPFCKKQQCILKVEENSYLVHSDSLTLYEKFTQIAKL